MFILNFTWRPRTVVHMSTSTSVSPVLLITQSWSWHVGPEWAQKVTCLQAILNKGSCCWAFASTNLACLYAHLNKSYILPSRGWAYEVSTVGCILQPFELFYSIIYSSSHSSSKIETDPLMPFLGTCPIPDCEAHYICRILVLWRWKICISFINCGQVLYTHILCAAVERLGSAKNRIHTFN